MLLSADRAETAYEAHRRRVGANNRVWRSPGPPFRPGVFSKHGAEVVLWDINGQTNEETAKLVRAREGPGTRVHGGCDKPEQVYRTADQVRKEMGRDVTYFGEQCRGAGRWSPSLEANQWWWYYGSLHLYMYSIGRHFIFSVFVPRESNPWKWSYMWAFDLSFEQLFEEFDLLFDQFDLIYLH